MPNKYSSGTFAWYWYEWWIPAVVAALALAVALAVFVTTDRKSYGTGIRAVVVLAFLGTLPLGLERIGIGISATEGGIAVLSILGAIGSAVSGLFHLVYTGRRRRAEVDEGEAAPGQPAAAAPVEQAGVGATLATGAPPAPEAAMGSTLDPVGGEATLMAEDPAPQATPPPAWVVFNTGPNQGQSIPVSGAVTRIGRSPDSDVVVEDQGASRDHAQITFVGGQYQLSDAGSAGGTMVDGAAAQETVPLASGTVVNIGQTELVFMQGQAPPAAAEPASGGQPPGRAAETMIVQPPKETLMAWLAVTAGPAKGATCQINVGETSIGRAEECDLRVNDASVSRRHAVVLGGEEGGMTLLDLGSSSGTTVNGKPLGGRSLSTTSVVNVGATELMLVDVERAEGEPATAGAADATMVGGPSSERGAGVLVARKGPDAGKTFQLAEGDNVIGREAAAVLLSDTTVSRQHAIVRKTGDSFTIYDLGSRAGTVVDGDKLEGAAVKGGDVIAVGRSQIVVMEPSGA